MMTHAWHVKKGDNVIVISGKDKGKKGEITQVLRKKDRVLVSGVNIVTRHQPTKPGKPGGITRKELPVHVSNVMHVDPQSGLPTRVGFRFLEDGSKVRFSKKSGEVIDR